MGYCLDIVEVQVILRADIHFFEVECEGLDVFQPKCPRAVKIVAVVVISAVVSDNSGILLDNVGAAAETFSLGLKCEMPSFSGNGIIRLKRDVEAVSNESMRDFG